MLQGTSPRAAGHLESPVWQRETGLVPYEPAVAAMEARVAAIRAGEEPELIWLLEHPPLLTAGTSAHDEDLLDAARFPVFRSGRGGQFTYHGPGQRIAYCMLDLKRRNPDLRRFVHDLEAWVIRTLATFGVKGERREGRVGIWVVREGQPEAKIAAIGVRVRRWVTYHGLSINVAPELDHFGAIVPCGLPQFGVTSLADLGVEASMEDVDEALMASFGEIFDQPAA